MAFQTFTDFYALIKGIQTSPFEDERAITENFILEERLGNEREKNYYSYVKTINNYNDWKNKHNNEYFSENIKHQNVPETFTGINSSNLLAGLEKDQYLIRVDKISYKACVNTKVTEEQMNNYLKEYLSDKRKHHDIIYPFFENWNKGRDSRPIFVGFWGEVKNIFEDNNGKEIVDNDWANKLRDLLGLTHYAAPTNVLLQRYRVRDLTESESDNNYAAIPTVLDSDFYPAFFPSPGSYTSGLIVDCSDDYSVIPEILHKKIEYKPEWLYRVGQINKPPKKSLDYSRNRHLDFLKSDLTNSKYL